MPDDRIVSAGLLPRRESGPVASPSRVCPIRFGV